MTEEVMRHVLAATVLLLFACTSCATIQKTGAKVCAGLTEVQENVTAAGQFAAGIVGPVGSAVASVVNLGLKGFCLLIGVGTSAPAAICDECLDLVGLGGEEEPTHATVDLGDPDPGDGGDGDSGR